MRKRATHGWCEACQEHSAVDSSGCCLWCGAPTRQKRGGGKPAGRYGFIKDTHLRSLHRLHQEGGFTVRELGRRIYERAGYSSAKSATNAILWGWRRLGLRALSQGESTALVNRRRAAQDSPGTADRKAYKRWLRERSGGYQRCAGTKLQHPGKGGPCSRYALTGSDFCIAHDPRRREQIVAHAASMRARIGRAA